MVDVTRELISHIEIREQVGTIFPDALVLTTQFRIVLISQNVLDALGYSRPELNDQPIDFLSHNYGLRTELEQKLRPGYFDGERFEVHTKKGSSVLFDVSGFYLGLVADINGFIVLRLRKVE